MTDIQTIISAIDNKKVSWIVALIDKAREQGYAAGYEAAQRLQLTQKLT